MTVETQPHRSHSLSLTPLSTREAEVVQLLAEGHSLARIAGRLHRSVETVKTHCRSLMRKLGARNRADVVRLAYQHGLVPLWRATDSASAMLPSHCWPIVAEAILSGPVALAVFSPRLKMLFETKAFARLLRSAPSRDSLDSVLTGAMRSDGPIRDDEAFADLPADGRRIAVRWPDGTEVALTCVPLRTPEGALEALLVVADDITPLARVRREVRSLRLASDAGALNQDREMETLRRTAALEIARRARHERLHAEVIDAVLAARNTLGFDGLAQRLCSALESSLVVIAERRPGGGEAVVVGRGGSDGPADAPNLIAPPWCDALAGRVAHYPSGVAGLFLDDATLAAIQAASFLAVPVAGRDGEVIGMIAIVDRAPRPEAGEALPILRLVAEHVGLILEGRRVEARHAETAARLRVLDEAGPIPMLVLDQGGACVSANAALLAATERSLDRCIGAGWRSVLAQDDLARLEDAARGLSREHPRASLPVALLAASGGRVRVRAEVALHWPTYGPAGGRVIAFLNAD